MDKHRNKKIRESARGETCALNIPTVCNNDPATVVWCHSPFASDGRGMGTKSHDILGAYGCSACHDVIDGRVQVPGIDNDERRRFFDTALKRSLIRLWRKGIQPW